MKNQVTLIGYVGAEPETRAYPSGDLVTSISLATSEKWRDRQSNELKEHTEWHRVVFRDRGGFKLGLRAKDLIQKERSFLFRASAHALMGERWH